MNNAQLTSLCLEEGPLQPGGDMLVTLQLWHMVSLPALHVLLAI